jgi:dihydroorotase
MGLGGPRCGRVRARPLGRRGARRSALRLVAPGEPAASDAGGRGCLLAALLDGTAAAVATDHDPHTQVDKEVEFGLASNGISGLETALGVLLAVVEAGRLPLARAIAALPGPARLATWSGGMACIRELRTRGVVEGALADLVVFDRADR